MVNRLLIAKVRVPELALAEAGALRLRLEHGLVALVEGGVHLLVVGHDDLVLVCIAAKQVALDV